MMEEKGEEQQESQSVSQCVDWKGGGDRSFALNTQTNGKRKKEKKERKKERALCGWKQKPASSTDLTLPAF